MPIFRCRERLIGTARLNESFFVLQGRLIVTVELNGPSRPPLYDRFAR